MTESQWLACADPEPMLDFLSGRKRSRTSKRKLMFFGCACCRRIWSLIPVGPCRQAVEIAERLADGQGTDRERSELGQRLYEDPEVGASEDWLRVEWEPAQGWYALEATSELVRPSRVDFSKVARDTAYEIAWDAWRMMSGDDASRTALEATQAGERLQQTILLRDIFGNPFRPPTIAPSWLTWHGATSPRLAEAIYADRAFDRLPILADALEDAGCDNADILAHCRGPGPHVRGCWVVDLLTGRE